MENYLVQLAVGLCLGAIIAAILKYLFSRRESEVPLPVGIIGPLGFKQKLCLRLEDTFGTPISCVLIMQSNQILTLPTIDDAVKHLMARHPLLRARIFQASKCSSEAYFVDIGSEAINRFTVTQVERGDWQTVLENGLSNTFNRETGPLWSVTFIPNVNYRPFQPFTKVENTWRNIPHSSIKMTNSETEYSPKLAEFESGLHLTFHHCMTDGTYRTRLIAELVDILDHMLTNKEVPMTECHLSRPLTDQLEKMNWRWMVLLRILVLCNGIIPIIMKKKLSGNVFVQRMRSKLCRNSSVVSRTRIISTEWSTDFTKVFLDACKKEGCTVHGALQIACGTAMAILMSNNDNSYKTPLTLAASVNLRPHLADIANDAPGIYLGIITTTEVFSPEITQEEFWKHAAASSQEIRRKIDCGEHLKLDRLGLGPEGMLDIVASCLKLPRDARDTFGRIPVDINISNLGKCRAFDKQFQSVFPRAIFCATPDHKVGPIFCPKIATFNGKIFLTLSYFENVVPRDFAAMFLDQVHGLLARMVSNSNGSN